MAVRCNIVVADDLDSGRIEDTIGVDLDFEVVPRVGEGIHGFGRVVEISHFPIEGGLTGPYVTIYVTRLPPTSP